MRHVALNVRTTDIALAGLIGVALGELAEVIELRQGIDVDRQFAGLTSLPHRAGRASIVRPIKRSRWFLTQL